MLVVPLLAGITGRGVKPLTWASCVIALVGVGLLEQGGAAPGIGDVWNLLSAMFFGLQVGYMLCAQDTQVVSIGSVRSLRISKANCALRF